MGWTDLAPIAKVRSTGALGAPITMRGDLAGKRRPARVTLSLRVPQLKKCAWLKSGAAVAAQLGDGLNSGKLRITPGGAFKLHETGGRGAVGTLTLALPLLPGMNPGRQPATVIGFIEGDRFLLIDLPLWARAAPKAPAPQADPPKPGFRGALATHGVITDGARRQLPIR